MKKLLSLIVMSYLFFAACKKSEFKDELIPGEIAGAVNSAVNNNGSEIVQNIPVSNVFLNECCNEEVFVTGIARITVNKNIIHFVIRDLTGIGLTTGFSYSSPVPSVLTNIFYSNPNEGILTSTLYMTNNDGCSFRIKFTFRLEVNANGDTVVSFEKIESICK